METQPPRRRGRPRSFDERAVLARARAVFLEKGYDATSLDDLSAATGLTRPSLFVRRIILGMGHSPPLP